MLPPAFKGHGLHARNSRQLHAVRWKAPFRLRRWCTTVAVHLLLHARCQIRATVFPLSTGACTGLLPSRRSRPSCSNRRRSRNQTSATCCAFPPNLPSSHAGDAGLVSGTSTWFSRSLGGLEELYTFMEQQLPRILLCCLCIRPQAVARAENPSFPSRLKPQINAEHRNRSILRPWTALHPSSHGRQEA